MRGLGPAIILIIVLSIVGTAAAVHASAAKPQAGAAQTRLIPDEAIRIRIIAQSDSEEDQAVKRAVRDRVSALIESWGPMPSTIDAARSLIRSHLADVQKTAERTLEEKGADYGATVELAKVPFPDKTFEGTDYPAGEYEALRITLGQGTGANWWCVLFPPLCLTAATAKDDPAPAADAKATSAVTSGEKPAKITKTSGEAKVQAEAAAGADRNDAGESDKPKTAFFLWILIEKLFAWLGSLFS